VTVRVEGPPTLGKALKPNRPAHFTTADLRRAVQIAKEGGPGWFVEILPDGTIRIAQGPPETPPEPRERVVL
jgi:hypothetical protein